VGSFGKEEGPRGRLVPDGAFKRVNIKYVKPETLFSIATELHSLDFTPRLVVVIQLSDLLTRNQATAAAAASPPTRLADLVGYLYQSQRL